MRLTNLHRKLAGAAVVITALLAGCSYNLSDVRKVTYPPDFNYIEPQDIKTDMARMAAQIRLLDIALAPVDSSDIAARENQREEVMAALNNIENIASGLQSVDGGSNHPYMRILCVTLWLRSTKHEVPHHWLSPATILPARLLVVARYAIR